MEQFTFLDWMLWPLFSYSVSTALEPWGKLPPESLSLTQRLISPLLFVLSVPFSLFALWTAFQRFGIGHALTAFFAAWLGMLFLAFSIHGLVAVILKVVVSDPEAGTRAFRAFRYGQFWPALAMSLFFGYQLSMLYCNRQQNGNGAHWGAVAYSVNS